MNKKLNPEEIKERILNLAQKMMGWYRTEMQALQDSRREVEKILQKKPKELTRNDGKDLQSEMKFLMRRLGDEDNYDKLEELNQQKREKEIEKLAFLLAALIRKFIRMALVLAR
ncbi:3144_t:CDS:2, partial [Racocetra persica]